MSVKDLICSKEKHLVITKVKVKVRPELLVCAMEVVKNSEGSKTLVELQMMEVMCLSDNF